MQSTFLNDDMDLALEHNTAWLRLPNAEPVVVIVITKIVWRGVERPVSLAVETNVFPADLGIEAIADEIYSDLAYGFD